MSDRRVERGRRPEVRCRRVGTGDVDHDVHVDVGHHAHVPGGTESDDGGHGPCLATEEVEVRCQRGITSARKRDQESERVRAGGSEVDHGRAGVARQVHTGERDAANLEGREAGRARQLARVVRRAPA